MNRFKVLTLALLLGIAITTKSQNTGPVAPEAVSFEPVDASNMVNMLTGDFSYVIPLLNIPSPEGGYPIALSYHGGITMDQEASWVGLGWNINPGAITRNVNGYPDDWMEKLSSTYTYIDGDVIETHTVGVGVGWGISGGAGLSLGLNYTWGSYRSVGVSLGVGLKGGFMAGISYDSHSGKFGANVGMGYNNIGFNASLNGGSFDLTMGARTEGGVGFSVSTNGSFSISKSGNLGSVGVTFSSGKAYGSLSVLGAGLNINNVRYSQADINVEGRSYGFFVPFYYFSVSYSHGRYHYWSFNDYTDVTNGTIYSYLSAQQAYYKDSKNMHELGAQDKNYRMDTYNIPYSAASFRNTNSDLYDNQLVLTATDNYGITAQGISGSLVPRSFTDHLLTSNSQMDNDLKTVDAFYYYNYLTIPSSQNYTTQFYLENEISGYAAVTAGTFSGSDPNSITFSGGVLQSEIDYKGKPYTGYNNDRKVSSNYVEWFTNKQIVDGTAKSKGFIDCDKIVSVRNNNNIFDEMGIGGFKITALDGKTYHYSLPVYQFESFLRKNGTKVGDFIEQRMLNPYATSWLLTSVTGPDYIDKNNNGIVDGSDYGYWVKFEYGKLTDCYIWQLPYDLGSKAYDTYDKEIQWGRKQIYYLNAIETRTHKAYFIKDVRSDGLGQKLTTSRGGNDMLKVNVVGYRSIPPGIWKKSDNTDYTGSQVRWYNRYISYNYSIDKEEKPLMLKKIILVKKGIHSNIIVNGLPGVNVQGSISTDDKINLFDHDKEWYQVNYHNDYLYSIHRKTDTDFSSNYNDVYITSTVNVPDIELYAVKVVNFSYDYQLCNQTPNSVSPEKGKLTLQNVQFLGQSGKQILPPYSFSYIKAGDNRYNVNNKDIWGYYANNPENWSLNEILLPTGGKLKVNYERNSFRNEAIFGDKLPIYSSHYIESENRYYLNVYSDIGSFKVGNAYKLIGSQSYSYEYRPTPNKDDMEVYTESVPVNGLITIAEVNIEQGKIFFNPPPFFDDLTSIVNSSNKSLRFASVIGYLDIPPVFEQYGGGVRVKDITLSDEMGNSYSTEYIYRMPNTTNTSGTICYSPYNLEDKYIPYITELPPPKVLYNYVSVSQSGNESVGTLTTTYEFQTYENASTNGFDFSLGNQFRVVNSQESTLLVDYTGDDQGKVYARSATIYNNLASVGLLKSVSSNNKFGQNLNKKSYEYLEPDEIQVGIQQETFKHIKRVQNILTIDPWKALLGELQILTQYNTWQFGSASRITYPSVPKSEKVESNGLMSRVNYDSYDFYTGNILSTTTLGVDGNEYRNELIPAYKISTHYADMGPKSIDPNNKNMLSQEAASLSYVKDNGGNWKPIGVNVQTWSNSWVESHYNDSYGGYSDQPLPNIWRKHKTFIWKGSLNNDGTLGSDFDAYDTPDELIANWSDFDGEGINGWQKTSEVTRYNRYSQPLEVIDINGNAASSRLDFDETKTVVTASNARFSQFTGCGFEDVKAATSQYLFEGQVISPVLGVAPMISDNAPASITGARLSGVNAHTGNRYIKLIGGAKGPAVNIPFGRKNFRASLWVHKNSTNVAIGISWIKPPTGEHRTDSFTMDNTNSKQFGDWYLFTPIISMPQYDTGGGEFYIECNGEGSVAYIDDFRVQPLEASANAYVYDPLTDAITYILNNDNIATKYEYDDAGRLKATYKETPSGFKKVSEHNQGYARPLENTFTLASEITAVLDINNQTGMKNVWVTLNITNNDFVARDANFTISLENAYSQNITSSIGGKQSKQVLVFFEISSSEEGSRLISVTGDIQAEKLISINSPPRIQIVSFTVDPLEAPLGASVTAVVVFMNGGTETGNFQFIWRHAIPDSGFEDSDPIEFELAPNDTKSFNFELQNINPAGMHSVGFWFTNNYNTSSFISVNCFDGSFPPQ